MHVSLTLMYTTNTYYTPSTQSTRTTYTQSHHIQKHTTDTSPHSHNTLRPHECITHRHTHTLLSRSVTWLLPPKQTKCVSPAIISLHEFFTSWNRGVAGSGRLVAGMWGKGSSPPLSCLTHTHRGNKIFCRIEFIYPIHLVLSFYNIM